MTRLPDCPRCDLPVGEGDCAWCRNVRTTELADAHQATDGAPVDAAWLGVILGDGWRDSPDLRGLVVLADRALAANPLNAAAVDRILAECSDAERKQVARFRYGLALGAITRGGVCGRTGPARRPARGRPRERRGARGSPREPGWP